MKNPSVLWLPPFLTTVWLSGFHVNDIARLLLVVILCAFLWKRGILLTTRMESMPSWMMRCFLVFLGFFGIFLFTEPFLAVFAGSHGIDFAIFTQVVDSIHRYGTPMTSLVSMEKSNFLTHHFVPFFYVPALLTSLGLPAYTALSSVHAVCGITAGLGFYLTARQLKFAPVQSLLFTVLLYANPTVRHGLFYGVHDEIFSLPFLMFAFWGFVSRRIGLTAVLLLLAATTKESLSAVGLAMIAMIVWDEQSITTRQKWLLALTGVALLFLFVGYFFLQPILLGKSFDHMSKLGSIDELLSLTTIKNKVLFLALILLPLLFFPILVWRQWHLFLPAAPLLGIIAISRFPDMWAPLNYYGVVPSFLLYAGSLVALSRSLDVQNFLSKQLVIAVMFCIAFASSTKKPIRTIVNVLRLPTFASEQLAMIPAEASVISSPAAALFLLRVESLWRLGNASQDSPQTFDFVVRKVNDMEVVEPGLAQKVNLCYSDKLWLVYCNKDERVQLKAVRTY